MNKVQLDNLIIRLREAFENERQFITKGFKLPWEECDDYADYIEENIGDYLYDNFETEKDVIDDIKESYPDGDDILDMMFDRDEDFNDDDDGIGSILSRDY